MVNLNIEKISKVLQRTQNIEFAYIFGSHVKNKTRFGSDLDIAVNFKKEPELLSIGMVVNDLEEITNYEVDLVMLNGLIEAHPKLAYSVISEGILLFNNNEESLTLYKKKAYLAFLDFEPVINLFDKILKERIYKNKFAEMPK